MQAQKQWFAEHPQEPAASIERHRQSAARGVADPIPPLAERTLSNPSQIVDSDPPQRRCRTLLTPPATERSQCDSD